MRHPNQLRGAVLLWAQMVLFSVSCYLLLGYHALGLKAEGIGISSALALVPGANVHLGSPRSRSLSRDAPLASPRCQGPGGPGPRPKCAESGWPSGRGGRAACARGVSAARCRFLDGKPAWKGRPEWGGPDNEGFCHLAVSRSGPS